MSCRFVQKVSNAVQCESKSSNLAVDMQSQMYPPGTTRLCFLVVFFWWRLSTYPPDDSFREDLKNVVFLGFPVRLTMILGDPDLRKWETDNLNQLWITLSEATLGTLTLNQLCFESVFLVLWLYWSLVLSDSFKHSPRFGLMIFATRKLHSV